MNRRAAAVAIALMALGGVRADDWPTYRHDAARSAWSSDSAPSEPVLHWRWRAALPPRPAWPAPAAGNVYAGLERLSRWDTSDHACHAVIVAGRVLFGSSADDSVHCLAATDGRTLWRHPTGGPVRMPPAVAGEFVYAGSDDGFLRCLRLADGAEEWRRRIGPEDRRMPGNARMISRWPVRAGPLVEGDAVLVAAGVFPFDGVFLAALDRRTGRLIWQRSIDAVAHGPLVALGDRLVVSALRANPSLFDLATGAPRGALAGAGPVAMAFRGTLVAGPAETGTVAGVDSAVQQALAVREGFQCATRDGRLAVASDRTLALFGADRRLAWKVERAATTALAAAGETIVAGGPDVVAGHATDDGARRWQVAVEGLPLGLALADGRLVVSTDRGDLWCFGSGGALPAGRAADQPAEEPPAAASAPPRARGELVRRLAGRLGPAAGYAVVAGPSAEACAAVIGRETELQAIGLVPESDLAAGRGRLAAAGLLGHRATLESAAAGVAAYDDGVFNLVVVELPTAAADGLSVPAAARLLAPGRGLLALVGAGAADAAAPAGLDPILDDPDCRLFRARPSAGAGSWTHPFADPGNTSCSGDELVKPPFEVHWFGPPGPDAMVDRHNRTTPPLFRDGRLFVAGLDAVICADAANGAALWRLPLPGATRLAVSKNCGNMVVGPAELFVAHDDACVALAVDSGRETRRWRVPEAAADAHDWGYLAVVDNVLLGSRSPREAARRRIGPRSWEWGYLDHTPVVTSDSLFAFDLAAGRLLWRTPLDGRVVVNASLAAADRLYAVEADAPAGAAGQGGRARLADLCGRRVALVARDLRSGAVAWRQPLTLAAEHSLFTVVSRGVVLLACTRNEGSGLVCELRGFAAADGRPLWERAVPTGLPVGGSHGEQEQHPLVVAGTVYFKTFACDLATGEPAGTWKLPPGGCGALSASLHAAFFRAGTAWCVDIPSASGRPLTGVTRPGCWLNMLPAGGLVLAPESSAGCTCQYPIQTSLALRPLAAPPPLIERLEPGAAPVPVDGDVEFAGRIEVAARPPAPDVSVHWTTGGGWPTRESPAATGPLAIADTATVHARSFTPRDRGGLVRRSFTRVASPRLATPGAEFVTSARVAFVALPGEAEIRYTADGTDPGAESPRYVGPFEVFADATVTARYFLAGRATGPATRADFRKVEGRAAVDPGPVEAGLAYDYFEGDGWTRLPDCDALVALRSGTVPRFVLPPHRGDGFTVRYRGFIRVPEDGIYRFFLRTDDGSDLAVAGEVVVANDGVHDARGEATGTVALAAGLHPLELRYFDAACQEVLQVSFAGPGFGKREIPAEALCRPAGAAAPAAADPGLAAVETALAPLGRSFMLEDPERAEAALEQARADLRRIAAEHAGREPAAQALRALAIYAGSDEERDEATAALWQAFPDHRAVGELRAVADVMAILALTAEAEDEAAAATAWQAALPKLVAIVEANPENEAGKRALVCLFMRTDDELVQEQYGRRLEKHFLADPFVRLILGHDCEEGECPDGLGAGPLFELPADGVGPAAGNR